LDPRSVAASFWGPAAAKAPQHRTEGTMNTVPAQSSANANTAKIIYILYLLALVNGVTAVVGVIMAYVYRDGAPEWLRTHLVFQIRTFWFLLLFGAISFVLCAILIGFLLLALLTLWWIMRCVKGLRLLVDQQPYPNPETLLF
jgi:uncharacterized membrane protein